MGRPRLTPSKRRKLEAIAFANPREVYGRRPEDLTPETKEALESVQLDAAGRIVGFQFKDKMAAIAELEGDEG